jgi:hypothetical protein
MFHCAPYLHSWFHIHEFCIRQNEKYVEVTLYVSVLMFVVVEEVVTSLESELGVTLRVPNRNYFESFK